MAEDFLEFEVRPTLSNTAQREVDKSIRKLGQLFNKMSFGIEKNFKFNFNGLKKNFDSIASSVSKKIGKLGSIITSPFKKASKDIKKEIKDIKKTSEKETKGIGSVFSTLPSSIKTALAGVVSIAGVMKGINLASAFEQEQGKLKFAMGNMSNDIQNFIKEMNKTTGLGEAVLTETAGKIGLKAKGIGFTGEILAKNTKNMTKLAYDMAGAMNMTVEEATSIIGSTLTGEMGALKEKTGVTISNEEVEAYAKNMGIAKDSITEIQKAQIRLNLLQKKMTNNDVKGGIKDALVTYEWIKSRISGQMKDAGIKFFTPLKNAMAESLKDLPSTIEKNMPNIEKIGQILGDSFSKLQVVLKQIKEETIFVVNKFIEWGKTSGYFEYLVTIFSSIWEVIKAIGSGIWEVIEAIGEVISEAVGDGETTFFDTIIECIKTLLPLILKVIKKITELAVSLIKTVGPKIANLFKEIFGYVEKAIKFVTEGVMKAINWISKVTGKKITIEAPEIKLPEGVEENVGSSFKGLDVGGYTPVKLDVASPYVNNSYSPTIQVTNNGNNEKDYTKKLSENIEKFHSDLGYDTRLKLVYGKG